MLRRIIRKENYWSLVKNMLSAFDFEWSAYKHSSVKKRILIIGSNQKKVNDLHFNHQQLSNIHVFISHSLAKKLHTEQFWKPTLLILTMAALKFYLCFFLVLVSFSSSETRSTNVYLTKGNQPLLESANKNKVFKASIGRQVGRPFINSNRVSPGGPDPRHH